MTRTDTVRKAAATTRGSMRQAAHTMAPYAGAARETAAAYAAQARRRATPVVTTAASQARHTARAQYKAHVAPRVAKARGAVPPRVAASASVCARRTRQTARQAAEYAAPRVGHALETALSATDPVREEAVARGNAALVALRGQVPASKINRLARRHNRPFWRGRTATGLLCASAAAGGAVAAWRWYRQSNPDWLVQEPSATEVAEETTVTTTTTTTTAGQPRPKDEPGRP